MSTPSKKRQHSHLPNSNVPSSSKVPSSSRVPYSSRRPSGASHAGPSHSMRKDVIPSVPPPAYQTHAPTEPSYTKNLQRVDETAVGTSVRADGSQRPPKNSIHKSPIQQSHRLGTSLRADGTQRPPSSMHKPPLPSAPAISRPPTQQPSVIRSLAPESVNSILRGPEDLKFALRQTRIETMMPKEREEQEEWAQSIIQRAGVCPEGYTWKRMKGGYQCNGGGHGVTDELIAEGKAGLLALRTKQWGKWDGPWYPNPDPNPNLKSPKFVKGENYTDEHGLHN